MTLEFLMPQPLQHQEETMYRQPNPSTCTPTYPSYNNYNQTPTSQFSSEYLPVPGSAPYQASATADVQQQGPPPTTNSWMSTGFPSSGLSPALDWSSPASQDPFPSVSGSYPVQTPAAPMGGSPYTSTDELDYYQGYGPSTASVNTVSQALHRPAMRSPYQDWMRSTAYRVNPQTGKTRTKDKYRVVYSDHQRLELEKEFHYSRYITIRRKAELAVSLGLSERQVKIWFQNRRAKERKQNKKRATSEGGTGDQNQIDPSTDKAITEVDYNMKKENAAISDKLEPIHNSPSTTPEVLDVERSHPHQHHHRTVLQPGLGMDSPQLPLLARGACQLESAHHAIMTDTLLHDIPQMLL